MNLWALQRRRKLPFLAGRLAEPNIPVAAIGPLTAWYSDLTAFLASAVADLKGVFNAFAVTITVCLLSPRHFTLAGAPSSLCTSSIPITAI